MYTGEVRDGMPHGLGVERFKVDAKSDILVDNTCTCMLAILVCLIIPLKRCSRPMFEKQQSRSQC